MTGVCWAFSGIGVGDSCFPPLPGPKYSPMTAPWEDRSAPLPFNED
jgi:hypothetical protein